ncbi:MAG: hydrogenase maturation nickel metallochaperone HypA [Nitrospirales bacterium]|nr:hydrogenase maturation nickel metallochaperone HypA [Nitrospirales bacterium]
MHEASIASSLLEIAVRECEGNGYKTIESVKVSIGKATGVLPEALLFAFEAMKTGTIAEKASLIIEEIPITGLCKSCNSEFRVDEKYVLCCPLCESASFTVTAGRELNITEMEVS